MRPAGRRARCSASARCRATARAGIAWSQCRRSRHRRRKRGRRRPRGSSESCSTEILRGLIGVPREDFARTSCNRTRVTTAQTRRKRARSLSVPAAGCRPAGCSATPPGAPRPWTRALAPRLWPPRLSSPAPTASRLTRPARACVARPAARARRRADPCHLAPHQPARRLTRARLRRRRPARPPASRA